MFNLKPEYLRWVTKGKAFLQHADELLVAAGAIEYGTPIERVLGMGSVGFTVLSMISPSESPQNLLTTSMGYEEIITPINTFLCDLLLKSKLPRKEVRINDTERFIFWDEVAAIYDKDLCTSGPYVKPGTDFKKVLAPVVWQGKDLILSVSGGISINKNSGAKSLTKFGLSPMELPGFYIGTPSVEYISNRLEKYDGNRAVMFVGPTGTGKSTLARLISHKLFKKAKILEITGEIVKAVKKDGLLDIATYLAPDVLIIDDVQGLLTSNNGVSSEILSVIEFMHHRVRLTFATLMDDGMNYRISKHGRFYYSGMRPGRVDEIYELRPPAARTRARILKKYMETTELPDGLVKASHSLTGAYLKELANRLSTHGVENWRKELSHLKMMAPKISTPKRSRTIKQVERLIDEIAYQNKEWRLTEEIGLSFDAIEHIQDNDLDTLLKELPKVIKKHEGLADQQEVTDHLKLYLENLTKKKEKDEESAATTQEEA